MRTTFGIAAVCVLTGSVAAGPMEPAHVPRDAVWVVHVDLDALRASPFLSEVADLEDVFADIDEDAVQELGSEVSDDFAGVTAFGYGGEDEDFGGAILYGAADLDTILKVVRERFPEHSRRTVADGSIVYTWSIDEVGVVASLRVNVAEARSGVDGPISPWLLLVAPNSTALTELEDVVVERRGNVERAAPPGSVIYFSATDIGRVLDEHGSGDASHIFASAESMTLAIGERDEQLVIDAEVAAVDEQTADDMRTMIEGLLAMARIAAASEPETRDALELAQGLTITTEGTRVHLMLEAPTAKVLELIDEQDEDGPHGSVNIGVNGDEVRAEVRVERTDGDRSGDDDH